jgi:hypothetical protein
MEIKIMRLKRISTTFLFSTLLAFGFSYPSFSEEIDFKDDYETKIDEIEKKDLGIYILGKVSDLETNLDLSNTQIKSSIENVQTNEKGEFFIRVKENDSLIINKETYKEQVIKISELKGKIKLEKIPLYLPLVPNLFGGIKYSNQGFYESLKDLTVSGRFNDGLNINVSGKVFNLFLFNLDYETFSSQIKRKLNTSDFVETSTKNISISGGYIFNLLEDRIDLALSLKTYLNNLAITNKSTLKEEDINRFDDYLDYGYTRMSTGLDVSAFLRPIRYTPITIQTSFSYYPFNKIDQTNAETMLPENINKYSLYIRGRYDLYNFVLYGDINYDSYFSTGYNSSITGFSTGFGYGF